MKAGIITIGDELLIGQTINTNLAWIGHELSNHGVNILQSCTIQDNTNAIKQTLDQFLEKVDLVIITGGLGPTNDDITKETLATYFQTKLILNEPVLTHVRSIFEKLGKEMVSLNIQQAMLPEGALILHNEDGTAPGMWFEKDKKIIISLPGVPYEMKNLMKKEVMPRVANHFKLKRKRYRTIMVQGIGESFLAEQIKDWEDRLTADRLSLAYLPSPGLIKLRISANNEEVELSLIDSYMEELTQMIPEYVYGTEEISIYEKVGTLLLERNATLGTVESCTGGGIANAFIQNAGASDYFQGGLITYSNELKMNLANVSSDSLHKYGAVSEIVAKEMAMGGLTKLGVDYAIAVTGIAGPGGGSIEKPVGTIWIAVASEKKVIAKRFLFGEHRGRNIEKTKLYAANLLRKLLLNIVD